MKISELLEAQSMSGALKKSLSKAEPGSKIDLKIKAHNAAVKMAKGSLATTDSRILKTAPEGYKFSNPKKLVSRLVLESRRDSDRDEWDSNMPGFKGHGFGKREREDDERHDLDVPKASGPWFIRVNGKVQLSNGRPEIFFDKDVARTEARKIYNDDKTLEVFVTASPKDTDQQNEALAEGLAQDLNKVLRGLGYKPDSKESTPGESKSWWVHPSKTNVSITELTKALKAVDSSVKLEPNYQFPQAKQMENAIDTGGDLLRTSFQRDGMLFVSVYKKKSAGKLAKQDVSQGFDPDMRNESQQNESYVMFDWYTAKTSEGKDIVFRFGGPKDNVSQYVKTKKYTKLKGPFKTKGSAEAASTKVSEGKSDFEGAKGLLNDINYDFSQIRNTEALTAKRGKGLKELLVRKYKATDFEIESEDWEGEDFQSGSFKVDGETIYFCFSEERNLALRFALKPYKQSMYESKTTLVQEENSALYDEAFEYFRFNCTPKQLGNEEAAVAKFKKNTKNKSEASTDKGEGEIYDALYTAKDDMAD